LFYDLRGDSLAGEPSAVARIVPAWAMPGDIEPGAVASSAIAATPDGTEGRLADVCAASDRKHS
jgi:hypothetical protein